MALPGFEALKFRNTEPRYNSKRPSRPYSQLDVRRVISLTLLRGQALRVFASQDWCSEAARFSAAIPWVRCCPAQLAVFEERLPEIFERRHHGIACQTLRACKIAMARRAGARISCIKG